MPRHRSVLLATSLCAALIGTAPSHAAPVDVIATLTPGAIGTDSPFGFSTLPAGPFAATLSFSGPLGANAEISTVAGLTSAGLTGFVLTIGTVTFGAADLLVAVMETDAAALVTTLQLFGRQGTLGPQFEFYSPSIFANVMWIASEGPCAFFNTFSPPQISGPCIAGLTPDGTTISQTSGDPVPVPAPGGLALFGLALLALGAARRRA